MIFNNILEYEGVFGKIRDLNRRYYLHNSLSRYFRRREPGTHTYFFLDDDSSVLYALKINRMLMRNLEVWIFILKESVDFLIKVVLYCLKHIGRDFLD